MELPYIWYMTYVQDFHKRVLGAVSDDTDRELLTVLLKSVRLQEIEKEFGKDINERLNKLAKSGLLIEVLRDNPSHIQRYYQTTELGQSVLRYLASKKAKGTKEE